jgi:hypothetical protein
MECMGTLNLRFIVRDDVEARQAMEEFKKLIERFVFTEINKEKKLINTQYKLQEVFTSRPPRKIKL